MFTSCVPTTSLGTPQNPGQPKPQSTPNDTPIPTPSTEGPTAMETETNPSLPNPARPDPQLLIDKAKEDLARRLSISVEEIELVEIDQVLWPDASLGCPQAGQVYAQVQNAGYQIRLAHDGDEFEYHANIHGLVFYCENPTPPLSQTPINTKP